MAAAIWTPNGGRLNSYLGSIGRYRWALTLKSVGWVLENLSARMEDVFVTPVTSSADTAFHKAILKARNVA